MISHFNAKAKLSSLHDGVGLNHLLFSESVTLLQQLIKTPSFSGQENEAADIIQHYLAGYSVKSERKGNNVWCFNKFYDPSKPTILLNSHSDTVWPNEGYKNDPFYPDISGGRLYGLGSNDAGGAVAALIAAFLHFYCYQGLAFNLCLTITAEEENSGLNGIKSILPILGELEFAIVGEPTLLQMAIKEKGNLVIDCINIGRPGHAAREEGDNAIYKCLSDLEWFKHYQFPKVSDGLPAVKMTVTAIIAGLQHNIIPAKCEYTVDIRNDDSYSHNDILDIIKRNISADIAVRPCSSGASAIPVDHPIVKTGIAIGCKTYSSPTSSDQAWLTIPSVKIGPGDSARSHAADEYIFLEEIKKGISVYIKLLDSLPLMLINNPVKYKNENKHFNN